MPGFLLKCTVTTVRSPNRFSLTASDTNNSLTEWVQRGNDGKVVIFDEFWREGPEIRGREEKKRKRGKERERGREEERKRRREEGKEWEQSTLPRTNNYIYKLPIVRPSGCYVSSSSK